MIWSLSEVEVTLGGHFEGYKNQIKTELASVTTNKCCFWFLQRSDLYASLTRKQIKNVTHSTSFSFIKFSIRALFTGD